MNSPVYMAGIDTHFSRFNQKDGGYAFIRIDQIIAIQKWFGSLDEGTFYDVLLETDRVITVVDLPDELVAFR